MQVKRGSHVRHEKMKARKRQMHEGRQEGKAHDWVF